MQDEHRYDDIINMPHKKSSTRSHMSLRDRAAQFAPFAALTGHNAAIRETARLVDEKIELDENTVENLNMKLHLILERLPEQPNAEITHFVADEMKSGGTYVTTTGAIKRIDEHKQNVVMADGMIIHISDIFNIEGELFHHLF